MLLEDVGIEALSDRRYARNLERTRRHDDLFAGVGPIVKLDEIPLRLAADHTYGAVQLDRQVEMTCIVRQVGNDVIAAGIPVRIAREGTPGEVVVPSGRE